MEELKVSDLVNLKKETVVDVQNTVKSLKSLSAQYHNMTDFYDPFELERIKREFNTYMENFAPLFAAVKKFKGAQHVYLDEVRKAIKAEALALLLEEGIKITAAESLVYKSEYYTKRINLMEDIKEFMIRTELQYERFETTFQSIVQSLSTAKQEYQNSQK